MSDPNEGDEAGLGHDAEVEKTPREGPGVNDMEADNAVEEETIETVDPDNAPA
ncbi:hypothetical protein [Agromyces bauzanensis]|uniref:Uncharacterized protein n=1 Tax=Agromyces bauzanensis TaxID=1308924 RepID=A0A917USP5_9MICO|nr:hypothetical protein [Agromyces bauzanensis]GGJ82596.1 hypothetical protein GCM10011372_21180 [Agromyces bauzanensis]